MTRGRGIVALLLLFALGAYLATGWGVVAPGEVVVVRRLGRVLPQPWQAGLHWGWPLGFEQRDRVRIDEVRRLEVGLVGVPGPDEEPGAGEFLTGDLNLLRLRAVVQYRVADPTAFVLQSESTTAILPRLAESSLSRALSRRGIDAALRDDRAALALDAADDLSNRVERCGLGLAILSVSLIDAAPPVEVQADFAAAQAARSERDRRLNEARTYQATTRAAAQAQARARTVAAKAQADRAVTLASSQADRFLALLAEARHSRPLTVRRLYLDALRDLLPRVRRTLILGPDEPIDLSLFDTPQADPAAP